MKISVKYFASLRELTGMSEDTVNSEKPLSVLQIWQLSTATESMPDNTLCAIDMEYVAADMLVTDSAEVAFFPPVTGGNA